MDAAGAIRAIRQAAGLTQYDFAEWLAVSRKTVQRWESGQAVPDARAEAALIGFCRQRGAFDASRRAPLAAVVADEGELRDVLAAARAPGDATPAPPIAEHGLVGREDALAGLREHLGRSRLVTVTGPGGVGKTELALAVAREAASPVHTVALAGVPDPALVATAVAEAVGARQGAAATLRESLVAVLGDEATLLVLDNFEHVLPAAGLVADLVASCPELTVLVTSRAPLRLRGEQEVPLSPLAVPSGGDDLALDDVLASPAIQLFTARAGAADPSFGLTLDSARDVAEVCAALDGLPLAIELAAARVRLLPPAELRQRLGRRLDLVRAAGGDRPERHRALRATLTWSHDLLAPEEREVFRRLAVFAGGFTLAAAEEVVPAEHGALDVVEALGALVDHSLVQPVDAAGGRRFRLLETVRAFAEEQLDEAGERADLRRRHLGHLLRVAERAAGRLRGPEQWEALSELRSLHGDLVVALDSAVDLGDDRAIRLAVALAGYWDARSALAEGREWLARVLVATPEPSPWRGAALTWAAYLAALQGDLAEARALAEEAFDLAERFDSDAARGYALLVSGGAAIEAGDDVEGVGLLEASLAAFRAAGDQWASARPLNSLAEAARSAGDLDRAMALHEEAHALCEALGDHHSQVMILCGIGHVRRLRGDLVAAEAAGTQAVDRARLADNGLGLATAFELLAAVAWAGGDAEQAARRWGAADRFRRRTGSTPEARDRDEQAAARAAVRDVLGEERYEAFLAAGAVS